MNSFDYTKPAQPGENTRSDAEEAQDYILAALAKVNAIFDDKHLVALLRDTSFAAFFAWEVLADEMYGAAKEHYDRGNP